MDLIITPFDKLALDQIIKKNIKLSAIKIASCDLTNLNLIEHCSKTGLPIILSTGNGVMKRNYINKQISKKINGRTCFSTL